MNNPALKREVSINKMLTLTNPRLRRFDVVVNSFHGCVSDTSKKFSGTPEMSFFEIVSQPRMFLQKSEGGITFKQLQSLANTHSCWKFNKQMDVINSNVNFIDFTLLPVSNLPKKKLTIHFETIKLERVHSIFNLPDKMESILSEAMFPRFQIHFSTPEHSSHYIQQFNSGGLESRPSVFSQQEILNLEGCNSSLG